jgi:hypothetical protein
MLGPSWRVDFVNARRGVAMCFVRNFIAANRLGMALYPIMMVTYRLVKVLYWLVPRKLLPLSWSWDKHATAVGWSWN